VGEILNVSIVISVKRFANTVLLSTLNVAVYFMDPWLTNRLSTNCLCLVVRGCVCFGRSLFLRIFLRLEASHGRRQEIDE